MNFIDFLLSLRRQFLAFRVLAKGQGQFNSILKSACLDAQSRPLPWYTYPAIEFLKFLDLSDKTVFEYGSGNSSLFWAIESKKVISVESEEKWYKEVLNHKKPNQEVWLEKDKNSYICAIERVNEPLDIIIIDGEARFECTKKAITHLKPGGMILLDNSDWFVTAVKFLREHDFIEIPFSGLGPINGYAWTTSVFIKTGSVPRFRYKNECPQPIGGIKQYVRE